MQNDIGVIVEQGFVAGTGLGYNPVDLNNKKNESCNNEQAE